MFIPFQLVWLCAFNNLKLSIMHLEDQPLKFLTIIHHSNVTRCLGAIGGDVWYLGVAKPSVVDLNVFKISGPKFMKLDMGTWHAGPLFESHAMDFYNLELSNTNLSSSTECLTSIVLWDVIYLIPKAHVNVGTLGHVHHGKTTLTTAITKVLTDEGKAKAIAIDEIDKALKEKEIMITIAMAHVEYETTQSHYAHINYPIMSRIHKLKKMVAEVGNNLTTRPPLNPIVFRYESLKPPSSSTTSK
ncbi:putative RmlC-like cupin domain-containing protein [Tanacetum coccineum]